MGTGRRTVAAAVAVLAFTALLPAGSGGASDDAFYDKQWGMEKIGAPAAWTVTKGAGVRIGIVDTGIDLTHEDLAGKVVASASCVNSGGDPAKCAGSAQDDYGHGTHVAGIAAALTGNGKGVAGVAPDAQFVIAKAFAGASGTAADVIAGVKWVVDHGAQVVNLSLGDALFVTAATFGTALSDAVNYAWSHGAVPVVASGNEDLFGLGVGSHEYGDLDALIVGSTLRDDSVAGYSSPTGDAKWALLAPGGGNDGMPGGGIYSTYWVENETNQYEYLSGTSMATPQVTGAVALLLAQGYTAQEAVDRILATVDTKVSCGAESINCKGRLDVARATGARS